MNKALGIVGVGGHARAVVGLLQDLQEPILAFYDDGVRKDESILGVKGFATCPPKDVELVLALGDNAKRQKEFTNWRPQISRPFVHPTAFVSTSAQIGVGTLVFPKAVVNTMAQVHENCIINSGAIIEHESVIGAHSHVSVGAKVCGRVVVGKSCFIGAGAIIKDQINICDNTQIGAGAVVIKDIVEPGTYVGVPAKKISA